MLTPHQSPWHFPTYQPFLVGERKEGRRKNRLGHKGRNVFIETGLLGCGGGRFSKAWGSPGTQLQVQGAETAPGQEPDSRPESGEKASEDDAVLIQRQQQQDGPAAQEAHVVQQEEEPGPLVPHFQHGWELRRWTSG